MERKIGEVFKFGGEWYQCVESQDGSCKHCDMNFEGKCPIPIKECTESGRSDKSYVIFKKLEKVGYSMPPMYITDYKHKRIAIEIKQTKEDMEEKKLNLKPFDIQKAREGKPVCTRDGRKARIICFDTINEINYPIIALIEGCDYETLCYYNEKGKAHFGNTFDLMMLPEKKEGWVNVYKGGLLDVKSYPTKKEAFDKASLEYYVDTIKINWEE